MIEAINRGDHFIAKNMHWRIVEKFTDWLCGHKQEYLTQCGDNLWNMNVTFTYEKGVDWINAYNAGSRFCPFCGGIPELRHETKCGGHGEFYQTAQVVCTECGASAKSVITDGYCGAETTELDAIEAWNRRV